MHMPLFCDWKKASVAKTNRLSFLTNIKKQQWTTRRCTTQPMPFDSPRLSVHHQAWFSCRGLPHANLYNFKHALYRFARYGGIYKNTVDQYEFCYSIWFFYRYERCHKSLALPDRLCFSAFLSSKFQNCLRNFKIFLQLDAYASIIDSKPTEIHKKRTFFFYFKNINFGHIFDDFGYLPCRWKIGHFFIFSKVNFGSSQKIVA